METITGSPTVRKAVYGERAYEEEKSPFDNIKQRSLGRYLNDLTTFESICSSLSKFGFSRNEAMIYVYLSKFGEQKAYKISKSLSLQRTETYKILRKLEEKGLVYRILGKPIQFAAVQVDKALDSLIHANRERIVHLEEEKIKVLDKWFSLSRPAQYVETPEEFIQVLKGKHQISVKVNEIIENARKEILIAVSEENLLRIFLFGSLDALSNKSKRIKIRFITNSSFKSSYVLRNVKLDQCEFSYMNFDGLPSFIISDDSLLLFLNYDGVKKDKNSRVLLTNQKDIIKILKISFHQFENGNLIVKTLSAEDNS